MASGGLFVVFALPVILSVALAAAVMADILDKPGRELSMWPRSHSSGGHGVHNNDDGSDDNVGDAGHDAGETAGSATKGALQITGLSQSYPVGGPLVVQVAVDDPALDCGDLYITIYSEDGEVLAQGAFFEQCFEGAVAVPYGEFFIDSPGSYRIVAEMLYGGGVISASEVVLVE